MTFSKEEKAAISRGRKHFVAMATSYALGVFNDNFFKQSTFLLAATYGRDHLQGWGTVLFSIPFIIFAAWSGWFADRFPKRRIVIAAKFLEFLAMLIGAFALINMNWWLMLGMVFLMGLQSTLFTPALNGSIPELYPEKYVTNANAQLKLATTLFILMGIASAGYVLDYGKGISGDYNGRLLIGIAAIGVAFIGFLSSIGTVNTGKYNKTTKFPIKGPFNSIEDIKSYFKDRSLFFAMLMSTLFYFLSSLVLPMLNSFGLKEIGFSASKTNMMSVALMIGVSIGAFVAAKLTKKITWPLIIAPAVSAFGAGLILTSSSMFFHSPAAFTLWPGLLITGVAGGIFLIPVTSFIQTRPPEGSKGRVISASNFMDFTGMLLAGLILILVDWWPTPAPSISLMVTGVLTVAISLKIYNFINIKNKVVINDQ